MTKACCSLFFALVAGSLLASQARATGIWISPEELRALPASGKAWEQVRAAAGRPIVDPNLSDQDDKTNTIVLAKALLAARSHNEALRGEVVDAVMAIIGTERGGRTLSLGRKLVTYVIAADLVGLPQDLDDHFRAFLQEVRIEELDGKTLCSTHETRPNNWGTHAGASRAAIDAYLGDTKDLARCAQVFRGWLGDRSAYAGFSFGDLSWQYDPANPVAVNPLGAVRDGNPIDGVLPDDQRRAGPYQWPPPHENYVYEALQGALVQAAILARNGYPDVWNWSDRALLRAYVWLRVYALFPPQGDDCWQMPLLDYYCGSTFWDGRPVSCGKNMGFTDWTHGGRHAPSTSR